MTAVPEPGGTSRQIPSQVELVALLAMLTATVAFSIDAMLPALPAIAADVSPDNPNHVQLVIASFVTGLGIGTLFSGPLSDAFGRIPVAVGGAVIYCICAGVAAFTQDLEMLLLARAVQGIGAAGPRIAALAIVRDLFSGRQMARIMSFIMIVFTLVPVLAPTMGAMILWSAGWRAIFISFAVFAFVSIAWLILRLPETLAVQDRRPFSVQKILAGIREVFSLPKVVSAIAVQTLIFSILFATLMSSQPIFDVVLDKGDSFPFWFGLIAAASATGSLLNATIVVRLGMRRVVTGALLGQLGISGLVLLILVLGAPSGTVLFLTVMVWMISVFCLAGLGIGNMNAIAMEPLGHIAGLAASIISAFSTIVSAIIAVPIGQSFDGSLTPLVVGVLALTVLALILLVKMPDP